MDEFKNLGEWAHALVRASGGGVDERLVRAPIGAGETQAQSGGFLVPEAFAADIVTTIYEDRNSVLPYFRKWNIPDGSNSLRVPGVDETSRANGLRWGGIFADFADEGIQQGFSFPKLKATQYSTEKIIGLAPVTNELMADAENLGQFLQSAFSDELHYKLEQYTLSAAGTGAGKPLSILNSSALLTLPAVTGQAAGSITIENLRSMWWGLPSASRKRAIWTAGESAMKEIAVATNDAIYPESGSTNPEDDLPRLMGRPLIETDVLPELGTPGDVMVIDPLWYGIASKPIQTAISAHVLFVGDQAVFRITWRVDAKPLISSKLTASDTDTRAAFVALAQR